MIGAITLDSSEQIQNQPKLQQLPPQHDTSVHLEMPWRFLRFAAFDSPRYVYYTDTNTTTHEKSVFPRTFVPFTASVVALIIVS